MQRILIETPVKAPVETPEALPEEEPLRKVVPDELCPTQKEKIIRVIP